MESILVFYVKNVLHDILNQQYLKIIIVKLILEKT